MIDHEYLYQATPGHWFLAYAEAEGEHNPIVEPDFNPQLTKENHHVPAGTEIQ